MAKAEYKSAIRSKNLIKHSLAELICEKEFNKITVTDVIERSGISRGTFYAHYKSVIEVLEQIKSDEFNNLFVFIGDECEKYSEFEDMSKLFTSIFEYLEKDFAYHKAIINSPLINNGLLFQIGLKYKDSVLNMLKRTLHTESDEHANVALMFCLGGIECVIYNWAEGKINMNGNEMAQSLSNILYRIVNCQTKCNTF